MKKNIWILALIVLLSLCTSNAIAEQDTYFQIKNNVTKCYRNADISLNGDGRRGSLFYVNSDGNGELVLEQTQGFCYSSGFIAGVAGYAEEWGKYEIEVHSLDTFACSTYQWNKSYFNDTYTIQLNKSGRYYIYIRPYTQTEMTRSYTATTFSNWNIPPRWWIKSKKNCTVSIEYIPSASEMAELLAKDTNSGAVNINRDQQTQRQDTSTASVVIQYITDDGKYNLSETQILSAGTHVINNKRMDGYILRSDATPGSVTVTVKNGTANPSNIIFLFTKEETPAQRSVTGTVQIYYQAIDGSWSENGTSIEYYPGTHTVYSGYDTYQHNGIMYRMIAGQSPTTVTVYEDGRVSMNPIVFYFEKEPAGGGSSSLEQKAIICRQPIFPRPGPNLGKNEYNYDNVIGQEVTVHTRALSQSGTNKWWVCFSGDLHTEGKVFHLDHMWVNESYLEGYDLFALPIDPKYPD